MKVIQVGFITNSSTTVAVVYWKPFKTFDKEELIQRLRDRLSQSHLNHLLEEYEDRGGYDLYLDEWSQEDFEIFQQKLNSVIEEMKNNDLVFATNDDFFDILAVEFFVYIMDMIRDDVLGLESYDL